MNRKPRRDLLSGGGLARVPCRCCSGSCAMSHNCPRGKSTCGCECHPRVFGASGRCEPGDALLLAWVADAAPVEARPLWRVALDSRTKAAPG